MSITQHGYVFVALGIQHEMRMCIIVICGLTLSLYNIFFPNYLIKGTIFREKSY